jgi:hypothetical protein
MAAALLRVLEGAVIRPDDAVTYEKFPARGGES